MKGENNIDGVLITSLKIIDTPGGNVFHGIKREDAGYSGFGEVYCSFVDFGTVKGWKLHQQMTLNLVVPVGAVRFVIYDERTDSPTYREFQELTLSANNYRRLTVPPKVWMAFKGVGGSENMVLNIANQPHDPGEADRKTVSEIPFVW